MRGQNCDTVGCGTCQDVARSPNVVERVAEEDSPFSK